MIAVVGLTATVVILATNADDGSEAGSADPLSLLSAEERRYAAAIASLSPAQIAALAYHQVSHPPLVTPRPPRVPILRWTDQAEGAA